jgi:hypothetical protein
MRLKLLAPAVAAVALSVAACGSASPSTTRRSAPPTGRTSILAASRPTRIYRVRLSEIAEHASGAPHGSGWAIIAFHGDAMMCWRFAHLHGFVNARPAHLDLGAKGQAGSLIETLSTGPRLHHQGCVAISPAVTRAIWSNPSRYDVNIPSTKYAHGAVRAQL